MCEVRVNGVPTGQSAVIFTSFPPNSEFDCGCSGSEPQGACCQQDGTCVVVPASQCNGTYLGDGTACQGTGACCYDADGDGTPESCQVVDEVCCQISFGGSFQGFGVACQGPVACCFSDGSCAVVDQLCCVAAGGALSPAGACLGDGNGNNIDDGCEDPQPMCQPTPDRLACEQTICPVAGQECLPRCLLQLNDGTLVVDKCECVSPNECHLEFDPATAAFTCVGSCPAGFICQTTTTTLATGEVRICCECVPDSPEVCPMNDTQPPLCQQLQATDCQSTDPTKTCLPRQITVTSAGLVADECVCFGPGDDCGPITFNGTIARCIGQCPVPPNNPTDLCLVHINGVSTGMPSIDTANLPTGSVLDCGCGGIDVMGACCLEDGTCVVVAPAQCQGVYLGDGTSCLGSGACCFDADGDGVPETCQIVDEICCESVFHGSFKGVGSSCAGDVACCFSDGRCIVMDEVCCVSAGGSLAPAGACLGDNNGNNIDDGCEDIPPDCQPTPDRTACVPTTCPVAGQECLPRCLLRLNDGTIVVDLCECVSPNECHLEFDPTTGSFTCVGVCPTGFICQTTTTTLPTGEIRICCECVPENPPEGACCLPDGTCVVVPASMCNGNYLGDGTACLGVGACCYDADGDGTPETCQVIDKVCCDLIAGSSFSGVGSLCLGDVACCLPDGRCVVLDEVCCASAGGVVPPGGVCLGDSNGNMIDDACESTPMCAVRPDRQGCEPTVCPNPGEECLPRCVRIYQDGTIVVETCECTSPDLCHLEFDAANSTFQCVGDCPPGFECTTSFTVDPVDLSKVFCCDCRPVPPTPCPLPPTGPGLCAALQQTQCETTEPGHVCLPRKIFMTADGPIAEECTCYGHGDECGPISVEGNIARCLGVCTVPPNNPGDLCLVRIDGVSTGMPSIDTTTVPVGASLDCGCGGVEVMGACCQEDGTCAVVPPSLCTGVYLGDGTVCGGVGACCFDADGDGLPDSCEVVDEVCCDALYGGTFQGVNTLCVGKGACCFDIPGGPIGQCIVVDRICCDDVGGVFQGLGTICLGDANGDGFDDLCVPVDCGPTPGGQSCNPVVCPDPGQECLPRCVMVYDDGTIEIVDCECRSPNECHLEWTPGADPICVGDCPPGFRCETEVVLTPIGRRICCDCVPDPPECEPTDDATDCKPHICPNPDEHCVPRCVRVTANGQVVVLDCDCRNPDECRVSDFAAGDLPVCTGNCPPGEQCVENLVINADGTIELCCDCAVIECECPGDMNGDGVRNGLDIGGFVRCLLGAPLPVDNCACADVDEDGDVDIDDASALVAVILSKAPCPKQELCPPQDLLLDISTGVDANGNVIPTGQPDDQWEVLSEPPPVGVLPRPAVVIPPNGAWNTIPGTQWISANGTGPNGTYVYQLCFCLDKRFSNPALDMMIRADDEFDVILNGNFLGTWGGCFNCPTPVGLTFANPNLFRPGENCLQIVVRNLGGVVTGFNMQGSVRATDGQCCCEPDDLFRDFASGVDDTGGLIASGADDDTWTVTVDAAGGTVPRPATVINPNSAWLTIPGTKWIAASYTGPNGVYTYEYCFCLEKWFENARLIMDLRADDNAEVYLNGNFVGATPLTYAFNTPLPTHIDVTNQTLFRVGENCIEVVVRNTHGVVTGVNIAGSITARNGLCCDDRAECGPRPDGLACEPVTCPESGQTCVPVCYNVNGDSVTVIDCDCRQPDECHAVWPGTLPAQIVCEGMCPPGMDCVQRVTQRADGSVDYCCECVENPITGACCFSVGGCVILSQQACQSQGGVYLGDFTSCLGDQACCLPNGACVDTDALCCELVYGGLPQGPGSVCLGDANGDGRDDLCYPPTCSPVPGTLRCRNVQCPELGDKCKPRCVRVELGTTYVIEVLDCECVGPNDCHIEIDSLTREATCVGGCVGLNAYCHTTFVDLGDGTAKMCCECIEIPEPYSCCNAETGQCLDLIPGATSCPVGYTLVAGPCGNLQACCLPSGVCLDTYLACCVDIGGIPMGAGTSCATTVCPAPICRPIPGTTRCSNTICPIAGQECLPRCVRIEPGTTNVIEVIDCDCVSPNECHIEVDPASNSFFCVGACPPGMTCRTIVSDLPDGTQQVCCECVDDPTQLACCNIDTGECLDLAPGTTQCPPGFSLVPGPCGNLIACCLPDGTCIDTFDACCSEMGGMAQPAGVTCESSPCGLTVNCLPVPGTPFCFDTVCPIPGQECRPRCVKTQPGSTFVLEVVDCECVSPNECHIEVDAANNWSCVGACSTPGAFCQTIITDNPDGTITICCQCMIP